MKRLLLSLAIIGSSSFLSAQNAATILPNTAALETESETDFSGRMVAGIDRFVSRQIALDKENRIRFWKRDTTSETAYSRSIQPNRDRLKEIIGAIDERLSITDLELVADTKHSAVLAENEHGAILRVRWQVFAGVHGEGLLIQPKGKVLARAVYLPDADTLPEILAGYTNGSFDPTLLNSGIQVVIPTLLSRESTHSGNKRLNLWTNCTHREWLYRQSFILGRHVIGYEVQKILALLDWFSAQPDRLPIAVAGVGEGGLLALYAGALDTRIDSVYVSGYYGPREELWKEPLYRNVFGLLREFGDAEIASMIAPRKLAIHHTDHPIIEGAPEPVDGQRKVAAPGNLTAAKPEAVQAEVKRAKSLAENIGGDWIQYYEPKAKTADIITHLFPLQTATEILNCLQSRSDFSVPTKTIPVSLQQTQVREFEVFTQGLFVTTEEERNVEFWKRLPIKSLPDFEKHTDVERQGFWAEIMGRFPDPDQPFNARSRLIRETATVSIYEVTLDVWEDVFAWGWLCLPKDRQSGARLPVVVCQHGLEGLPEHTVESDTNSRAYRAYKAYALKLAEQGYVTFAPHNPYRGFDAFRTLQRKLIPQGKTLFSIIIGQHQRILQWLKQQPFTDPERIAFYGLSYGGKSAMRIPAVLPDYCLSICSGDFNEWVRKCASTDQRASYIFTHEYEIWEWNLGRTFNYAEMAALIAPRPFMVERGHNDGVAIDEWVNYEYAKIRRLYNKLGIGHFTKIEHFDGPHAINAKETFEFLHEHLMRSP